MTILVIYDPLFCSSVSSCLEHYKYVINLELADPGTESQIKPDILIGSDYYWQLVTGETIRSGDTGPIAVNTQLGWILSGLVLSKGEPEMAVFVTHILRVDVSTED